MKKAVVLALLAPFLLLSCGQPVKSSSSAEASLVSSEKNIDNVDGLTIKDVGEEEAPLYNQIDWVSNRDDFVYSFHASEDNPGIYIDDYRGNSANVLIPEELPNDKGQLSPVIGISPNAFFKRSSIVSLAIPKPVEVIGDFALDMPNLKNLFLPEYVRGFSASTIGSSPLQVIRNGNVLYLPGQSTNYQMAFGFSYKESEKPNAISLHPTCTGVKSGAFDGFTGTVGFGTNVHTLGKRTINPNSPTFSFVDPGKSRRINACSALENEWANIEGVDFVSLPGDVGIAKSAFANSSVKEIEFTRGGLTEIGDSAFYATRLTAFDFPSTLVSIGPSAFSQCKALAKIALPDSLKTIGEHGFSNCDSLAEVTFGSSLESLGMYAFAKDPIESIVLKGVNLKIGSYAFLESKMTSLTLDEGVASIDSYAFDGCKLPTKLTLPRSVSKLSDYCFRNSGVKNLVLPKDTKLATVGQSIYGDESYCVATYLGSKTEWDALNIKEKANLGAGSPFLYHQDGATLVIDGGSFIPYGAFANNSTITSITIPSSISAIAPYAFSECKNLKTVAFEKGEGNLDIGQSAFASSGVEELIFYRPIPKVGAHAFDGCASLKELAFPQNEGKLRCEIGDFAFANCSSLPAVSLYFPTLTIGESAFENCESLETVCLTNHTSEIGKRAFALCSKMQTLRSDDVPVDGVVIADVSGDLGDEAFYGCSSMDTILLPKDIANIGTAAFEGCSKLMWFEAQTVATADSQVNTKAFYGCALLSTVKLPSSTRSIGSSAFEGCTSLKTINFPTVLSSIYEKAFFGAGLTELKPSAYLTTIGKLAFSKCPLTSIDLSKCSITTLGDAAFASCLSLESAKFANSLTAISPSTFEGCFELASCNIPTSCKYIEERAFEATGLTSIAFPKSLLGIRRRAFFNCTKLESVSYAGAPSGWTNISYNFTGQDWAYGVPATEVTCSGGTAPLIYKG